MKKLIGLTIICILIVIGIYYAKNSGFWNGDKILSGKTISNENIDTNSLQSKNSVYYYTQLSDYEKEIYNKMLRGISKLDKKISLDVTTNLDKDKLVGDISNCISYVLADHPEIWYVVSNYQIRVNNYLGINVIKIDMQYEATSLSELDKEVSKVETEIQKIIKAVIKSGMTDYEKELAVHDYLAENVVYYKYTDVENIPNEKHNAYSAIIKKSAVCDGYTKAYQLILNKLNIENILVEGTSDGVPHAWNMIKLDGQYYHTDLTSSATIMGETKENLPVHVYFNVTDSDILETHTIVKREKLPKAVATKYNYYKQEEKEITHMDNVDYKIGDIVYNNKNTKLIEIKITGVYNTSEKLLDGLYRLDYNKMKTRGEKRIVYNKVLDVYIVPNM